MTNLGDLKVYCRRCGYQFDPANPNRPILVIPSPKGTVYVACSDCITEMARADTDDKKRKILDSMRATEA